MSLASEASLAAGKHDSVSRVCFNRSSGVPACRAGRPFRPSGPSPAAVATSTQDACLGWVSSLPSLRSTVKVHAQTPGHCEGDSGVDTGTFHTCAHHFPCDAGSRPEPELEPPCPQGRPVQKPRGEVGMGSSLLALAGGAPLLWGPSQEPPCPGLSLADAWQPQSPTLLSCSVPEGLTEPTRDPGTVALQCAPARHLAENAEASEEHVVGFSFFLSLWQHFLSGVADGEAFCGRGAGGGHMGPSFCRASVTE